MLAHPRPLEWVVRVCWPSTALASQAAVVWMLEWSHHSLHPQTIAHWSPLAKAQYSQSQRLLAVTVMTAAWHEAAAADGLAVTFV